MLPFNTLNQNYYLAIRKYLWYFVHIEFTGARLRMKSSTLRRSALSKESIDVLEVLSDGKSDNDFEQIRPDFFDEDKSNEYYSEDDNENKSKEIDLLWQSFKTAQFNTQSPLMNGIAGFILGVFTTLTVIGIINFVSNSDTDSFAYKVKSKIHNVFVSKTVPTEQEIQSEEVSAQVSVPTEDETQAPEEAAQDSQSEQQVSVNLNNAKQYTVVSGDTGEAIIKRFYGSYTPQRAELVMKANNLPNLDRINIGQVLVIPAEQ